MPLLFIGLLGIFGVLLGYHRIRPMRSRRKKYDAGAVSDYWLGQHRTQDRSDKLRR